MPGRPHASAPRPRATALPPAERRAAIVAATIPLLAEHGRSVTTRQIAEAAGIAEGTIFRVFADKDSLIEAAFDAALDPAPTAAAIARIDAGLPLRRRLEQAVELLQRRVMDVWRLITTVGHTPGGPARPRPDLRNTPDLAALAAVLAPDADRLRRSPEEAAFLLRGFVLAGTHPAFSFDRPLPAGEIVDLFLDGVRRRPVDYADPAGALDEALTDALDDALRRLAADATTPAKPTRPAGTTGPTDPRTA